MSRKKGTIEKVVGAATEATVELGEAAKAFRGSLEHIKKARAKAKPATTVAARATKTVTRTVSKATKRTFGRK